jgi:hypothetical protein
LLAFSSDYFAFLSSVKKQNWSSIVGTLTSLLVGQFGGWISGIGKWFLFSSAAPYAFMAWTGTPLPSSENMD